MSIPAPALTTYQLSDRYTAQSGRVFLTGTQALVRVMFDQARRDRAQGLNTAGFVSGYRGSPLGALDLELWKARASCEQERIEFLPAVNEDLGAAAVLGAQQAPLNKGCDVDGLFSMWYGKGPGVDRSGDALKHGNAFGSSPKGGVLVVAGDDHGCVSSSMPHQSDVAFMSWFMPTLNPASVAEFLTFGEYGFALSRFSGTWVGFKAISETVESAQSVTLAAPREFVTPDFTSPPGGLHVRAGDLPSPEIETRLIGKLDAVEAFVEANPIDRRIYDIEAATFGIVTTGKAHLDLMEALRLLGLDEDKCRHLGIDIYKVGMVWPLARRDALAFVRGKKEVLVVEEKRGIIESQFKEYFYDWPGDKPAKMVGKHRAAGDPLIPWTGELSPLLLVPIVAERLDAFFPDEKLLQKAAALTKIPAPLLSLPGATRKPYFCSGCPHNSSTKVPEGSRAASGIGCHVMASWMDRNTDGYAQMGGEGVPWIAASRHLGNAHIFQNLGEGTWYHSGSMAIRQAVAANVNITYKILYNDAVAMTGGQPVDGPVSVQAIANTCRAEGVARIALVSDNIHKFKAKDFPAGTSFHDRHELDTLQKELREIPGVSVLIYEQVCATEKRRRRKRGTLPDANKVAVINPMVCEGCGDCSKASNCLSVEPLETAFGRKRQINQSSCNKDFSCVDGFCPSFVTLEGARLRKTQRVDAATLARVAMLPTPNIPALQQPYNLLVAGVGGTGIVTIGALISMAAHLEGKGSSVLDFTGFAQKFGTVIGYLRLAPSPDDIHQVRIEERAADALIACDAVVASSPKASVHFRPGMGVVLNRAEMPTGDLVLHRDAALDIDQREAMVRREIGDAPMTSFDANKLAKELMGDTVFANIMLLGAAWQAGLVPLSETALKQAMALNNVAVENNKIAFDIGRLQVADPDALSALLSPPIHQPDGFEEVVAHRANALATYHSPAYAARFAKKIRSLHAVLPVESRDQLGVLAAKSLFKMMAIKDEYEVARLLSDKSFQADLKARFEGDFKMTFHLAPPFLPLGKDAAGHPRKRAFGPWMRAALGVLSKAKPLRGSLLDPFRYSRDRRLDRALLVWFEEILTLIEQAPEKYEQTALATILSAPMDIRGYGHIREKTAAEVRERIAALMKG